MPRKHIAVVADEYVATAYRLVGVEDYPVRSPEEAVKALERIRVREDIGLVFVAADLFEDSRVQEALRRLRGERPEILVSKLPTPRHPGKPVDMRRKLLQALGMG